jgi:hypothetical protein
METKTSPEFKLGAFAADVAKALGPTWTLKPRTSDQDDFDAYAHYAEINDSAMQARIGFSQVWNKKTHVHISGAYNDRDAKGKTFWNLPYGTKNPDINSAIARGAASVAKDITRRLLPDYLPLLAQCLKAWEEYGTHDTKLHATAERLGLTFGVEPDYSNQYTARLSLYRSRALPESMCDITVNPDEVRIDHLDVTPAECVEMFKALFAFRKAQKK